MTDQPSHDSDVVVTDLVRLVDRARDLVSGSRRVVLGIVGAPGAGKSTLCDALQDAFGSAVAIVGMDGFHLANEELVRLGRRGRKGAPDTFDVDGYVSVLRRIRAQEPGTTVYAPLFHRDLELAVAGSIAVTFDVRLVVTEGNYLLLEGGGWQHVRACLDHAWYLDVTSDERRRRLVERRRSYGEDHEEAMSWVTGVDEANARTVEPSRARADLVVQLTGPPRRRASAR